MAQFHRIGGRKENIREMLLAAGIGEFNATMSIPYMYFLPRTCDPYTQGVMQIVEGLQNLLNARGEHLPIDGWMGPTTMDALVKYAGPGWRDKTWVQLYGDLFRGRRAHGYERDAASHTPDLAGYVEETGFAPTAGILDGLATNPLAWLAAGGLAYYFFGRQRARAPAKRISSSSSYRRLRL